MLSPESVTAILFSHRYSLAPFLTVLPRNRPSSFIKRRHVWWSHVAALRLRSLALLLLLPLSPVSSRTFITSKRNSPPGAPGHAHCVAIQVLELDVPLLKHIHTVDRTTSTEHNRREEHTLLCQAQLYLHPLLLRASASYLLRLVCGT
jgi:hypothetical protein